MRSPWPVCWKAAPVVRAAIDPAATPGGTHTPPARANTPLTSAPEIAWGGARQVAIMVTGWLVAIMVTGSRR
eukprot:1401228-Rhodomonas_salina.1